MTNPIAATATSHAVAKIVSACVLTAGLTVGGTAAVTGNLPDTAQDVASHLGAHIGLNLPESGAGTPAEASTSGQVFGVVSIPAVGQIEVGIDEKSRLVVGDITAETGFTGNVVVHSPVHVVVDFESSRRSVTVDLTQLEGTVHAGIVTQTGPADDSGARLSAVVDADARLTLVPGHAVFADSEAALSSEGSAEADLGGTGQVTTCGSCEEGQSTGVGAGATLDVRGGEAPGPAAGQGTSCGCSPEQNTPQPSTVWEDADLGLGIRISVGG